MPEIAGDLIDYFSPYDAKNCLDKIIEYATDDKKLAVKNRHIKEVYKDFSWDDSFEQFKVAIFS
jgi:hypothetical protein